MRLIFHTLFLSARVEEQVVSIRVPYQGSAGRTKQAVDLLSPKQGCSSFPARMVWMRLSRKQIFQALQNQGGAPIPLCWVMAKLKKELILLYTPHPVEARGAQIHPFKGVSVGSRASWATQQQGDLTKLCEAGLITTTFERTHTHRGLVSAGTRQELNQHPTWHQQD